MPGCHRSRRRCAIKRYIERVAIVRFLTSRIFKFPSPPPTVHAYLACSVSSGKERGRGSKGIFSIKTKPPANLYITIHGASLPLTRRRPGNKTGHGTSTSVETELPGPKYQKEPRRAFIASNSGHDRTYTVSNKFVNGQATTEMSHTPTRGAHTRGRSPRAHGDTRSFRSAWLCAACLGSRGCWRWLRALRVGTEARRTDMGAPRESGYYRQTLIWSRPGLPSNFRALTRPLTRLSVNAPKRRDAFSTPAFYRHGGLYRLQAWPGTLRANLCASWLRGRGTCCENNVCRYA